MGELDDGYVESDWAWPYSARIRRLDGSEVQTMHHSEKRVEVGDILELSDITCRVERVVQPKPRLDPGKLECVELERAY